MSLSLYQPATKSGIIDLIYSNTGTDATKYPLVEVVRDINLAKDMYFSIAIQASGIWQLDDSNQTDYPIITTNIVDGTTTKQRDYSFTVDGSGNLILDIYRVMVADENGIFHDLELRDQQTKGQAFGMVDGQNVLGVPTKYDKTANGIFLDAIPNYNRTGGLKIFINRESTRFTVPTINVADNTKPGFCGLLDEYFAVRPTAFYSSRKGLSNANFYNNELLKYEGDERLGIKSKIKKYYADRSRDERLVITSESVNSV